MPSAGFAKVHAHHYSPEAFGVGAWGPLSIVHVVSFCKELHEMLEAGESVAMFSSQRIGMSANVALLAGAYLILQMGMPAGEAVRRLPEEALKLCFPKPWAASPFWHKHSLDVESCLRGLAVAVRRGWLDYAGFNPQDWKQSYETFDASPVCQVPLGGPARGRAGLKVWAIADPVTTVADSNVRPPPPEEGFVPDYSQILPRFERKDRAKTTPCLQSPHVSETSTRDTADAPSRRTTTPQILVKKSCSASSDEIDAKSSSKSSSDSDTWLWRERIHHWSLQQHRRGSKVAQLVKKRSRTSMPEFGGWLQTEGCRRLVRLNFGDERSLPPGGSYADYFTQWHIKQEGFEFEDCTAPSRAIVRAFVQFMDSVCEEAKLDPTGAGGSVVLHCTAGLGRTMTLLGAYAVERLGISGAAWMGWARMCRPGSVQTAEQESFLWTRAPEREGHAGGFLGGCLGLLGRRKGAAKTLEDEKGEAGHEEFVAAYTI